MKDLLNQLKDSFEKCIFGIEKFPKMKLRIQYTLIILSTVVGIYACNETKKSHYDQLIDHKTEKEYVGALNQSFEEIKKTEDKAFLITEDFDLLSYEYEIGEDDDTYQVTYRFDEKGCHEVGIDVYINQPEPSKMVVNGFKNYFNTSKDFKVPSEDNDLLRWTSENELLVAELDFSNAERGRIALTIFAYE